MKTDLEIQRAWHAVLFVFLCLGSIALLHGQSLTQQPGASARSAVRFLSPKEGEELTTNIVNCKYAQVQPASQDETPTFQLRLDDQDPLRTMMTEHTFTGLKEGRHVIAVQLLDANDIPIPGTQAEIHFKVLPQQPRPSSLRQPVPLRASAESRPRLLRVAGKSETPAGKALAQTPLTQQSPDGRELPQTGSPLPLLSIVCGGALAGGAISVLRTRGRRRK
ncbi:MAG TPA: hypothetical protein VK129_08215 [Terriglobales bacterium]|nr:hypothetical protein [Terriglobales bacterium]